MYSYVVSTVFFGFFTLFLSAIGNCICKKKSFSESLVSGYIYYSFGIAIAGIGVQILNLPWHVFAVLMNAWWMFLLIFCIYLHIKKNRKIISIYNIKEYWVNNWVILIIMVILVGFTLLYYKGFWLGNHQDDGYYISKIVTMPTTQTGGNFMYPLGVSVLGFNPYVVNTWEIEASVYIKVLKVSPTLFLRFFQSMFNFFICLNLIKSLACEILRKIDVHINLSLAQFSTIVVVFFDMHYLYLSDTGLFNLRDMFMVNTGMFLGNSIVKLFGIPLLLYGVIYEEKISKKMIVNAGIISVVLMSKSTIALPIIGIMGISVLISWTLFSNGKKEKGFACIFACICIVIAVILPNNLNIQEAMWKNMKNAISSPVIWICIVIFIFSFWENNKIIYRINCIIVLMELLLIVPQVNDLFETLSVYGFVAGRAVASIAYFFVIVDVIYLIALLKRVIRNQRWIRLIYIALLMIIFENAIAGFKAYGGGLFPGQTPETAEIKKSLSVLKQNPYFMPNSTIELGTKLDSLSKESKEQLRVVSDKMAVVDDTWHPLAIWLRIYAPNIISISAAERYGTNDGSPLSKYTQKEFEVFENEPSDKNAAAFFDEIKDLNVNCIVVRNKECESWLEKKNFKLRDQVEGYYYIYYKK